jgi:hypothetical protein
MHDGTANTRYYDVGVAHPETLVASGRIGAASNDEATRLIDVIGDRTSRNTGSITSNKSRGSSYSIMMLTLTAASALS